MKLWLKLKFWVLRKDNFPSAAECEWALGQVLMTERIAQAVTFIADGFSLETAAQEMGLPRERVRQMVMKGVRQARTKNAIHL